MTRYLDEDGEPDSRIHAGLRARRMLDEMLGLCRGIILDGVVDGTEATGLMQWLERHPEVVGTFPANVVTRRLHRIFADGMIQDVEREELRALLEQVVGSDPMATTEADWSTTLAFDNPPPHLTYHGRRFCFTGKFYYGSRAACERAAADLGAVVLSSIRKDLDYLVVGLLGSRDWLHSTHGTKIEKALEHRDRGLRLAIVSEEHWSRSLV